MSSVKYLKIVGGAFSSASNVADDLTINSVVAGGANIPGLFTATKEPTGLLDRTATLSWTDTSPARTFNITGSHTIYINGVATAKTTTSLQIANTTGLHFIYYDSSGTLVENTSFPGFYLPFVATVYWNATTGKGIVGEERHGITMDGATHDYLHSTIGTRYISGMALSAITNTTFQVDAGSIADEDITITTSNATTCDVLYQNGSTDYQWDANQTALYGTSLRYNNGTALTAVPTSNYSALWIFATNSITRPIAVVIGQRVDTTIANARTNNTYDTLVLGSLPFKEMKLLYRVLYRNLAGTATYQESADYRSVSNIPSGTYVATAHGSLAGLAAPADDHTQYALLAGRSGGQTLIGGTGTTDTLTIQTTSGVGATGADLIFKVGNNGGTEALRIINSGRVGVNTATPSENLTVKEGGQGTTGAPLGIHTLNDTAWGINCYNDSYSTTSPVWSAFGRNAGEFVMGTRSAHDFNLFVGDNSTSPELSIKGSTGYLGLKTSSTTVNSRLTVGLGDVEIWNGRVLVAKTTIPTAFGAPYLSIGGSEWHANSIQSVGFGYRSSGSSNDYPPAEVGFTATVTTGNTKGDLVFAARDSTSNIQAVERVRITSAGSLGVGTATPYFKTDVAGSVRIQGANYLYFGGTGASDNDTNLYRAAAGTLKTDGALTVDGGLLTASKSASITMANSGVVGLVVNQASGATVDTFQVGDAVGGFPLVAGGAGTAGRYVTLNGATLSKTQVASVTPLTVRAWNSQTANIFQVQDSGSNNLVYVTGAGALISSSIDAPDSSTTLAIGGTNSNGLSLGRTGNTTTVLGDFQVNGVETIIGGTTFGSQINLGPVAPATSIVTTQNSVLFQTQYAYWSGASVTAPGFAIRASPWSPLPGAGDLSFLDGGATERARLLSGSSLFQVNNLDTLTATVMYLGGVNATTITIGRSGQNVVFSNNVGIGVTPTARLHVQGSASVPTISGTTSLTADGTFASSTGWTTNTGWAIGSGVATHTTLNTGLLSGTSSAVSTSLVYKVTFDLTTTTTGSGVTVSLGGTQSRSFWLDSSTHTVYLRPTDSSGTLSFVPLGTGAWAGTVDNVVINQVSASTADAQIQNSDGSTANIEFRAGGVSYESVFIGRNAGKFAIGGSGGNVAIGNGAGQYISNGYNIVAVGQGAMANSSEGAACTAVGHEALNALTTGYANTAIGADAGRSATTAQFMTAIGYATLQNANGNDNTALGYYTLTGITSGTGNTAIGSTTGLGITTGTGNTILGAGIGSLASTLSNNIILASGSSARATFDGTNWSFAGKIVDPTFLGASSVPTVSGTTSLTADGSFDTSTGWTVGSGWTVATSVATHATGNTAALSGTSTATTASVIYKVVFTLSTTTAGAGLAVSLGGTTHGVTFNSSNTFITYFKPTDTSGTLSFTPAGTGTWVGTVDTVAIYALTPSTADVDIQSSDGTGYKMEFRACGTSNSSIAVGQISGRNNLATENTVVGHSAAVYLTDGASNCAFGFQALFGCVSGFGNIGIGRNALAANAYGNYNVAMGYSALGSVLSTQGSVAVGCYTLDAATGGSNTGVGYTTLSDVTSGTNNTAIGYNTGPGLTTGSGNTLLGAGIAGLSSSLTNNIILASGSGTTRAQFDGTDWTLQGALKFASATFTVETGQSVAANDPLEISSADKVQKALATGYNYVVGFAVAAASAGQSVGVRTNGVLTGVLTSATPGTPYYLSATGTFTATDPSTSGYIIQRVGWAKNATDLLINIGEPTLIP